MKILQTFSIWFLLEIVELSRDNQWKNMKPSYYLKVYWSKEHDKLNSRSEKIIHLIWFSEFEMKWKFYKGLSVIIAILCRLLALTGTHKNHTLNSFSILQTSDNGSNTSPESTAPDNT